MRFTQSVMRPTVRGKTLLRSSSLKLLLFDPGHILAPRKVAFAFLVGPAKKIQSIRQVVVTRRARTSIGQVVQFLPSAISLWIYSVTSLSGVCPSECPKAPSNSLPFMGTLQLRSASFVSVVLMELSTNLHDVAAHISLSL